MLSAAALVLCASGSDAAPGCADATSTAPQGDHYRANAPLRTTLAKAGAAGTRVVLSGRVVDHNCRNVLGALLEFWQADDAGQYDGQGFDFRGRQTTDTQGRYRLETIIPGMGEGGARAIYVKVASQGGRVVTTRLFFPGAPGNADDPAYRAELLVKTEPGREGLIATYDFVLPPP